MQKHGRKGCSTSHAADTAAAEHSTQAGAEGQGQVKSMGRASADSKQAAKPAGSIIGPSTSSSSGACVKYPAGSKSVTAGAGLSAAAAAASAAFVAAKLGLGDQLEAALAKTPGCSCLRDAEGRCCLHYAAGYGHEVRLLMMMQSQLPAIALLRAGVARLMQARCNGQHELQLVWCTSSIRLVQTRCADAVVTAHVIHRHS
jgi:hypothetical protein